MGKPLSPVGVTCPSAGRGLPLCVMKKRLVLNRETVASLRVQTNVKAGEPYPPTLQPSCPQQSQGGGGKEPTVDSIGATIQAPDAPPILIATPGAFG